MKFGYFRELANTQAASLARLFAGIKGSLPELKIDVPGIDLKKKFVIGVSQSNSETKTRQIIPSPFYLEGILNS